MKRFAVLALAVLVVALAGCNTMRGFGQDMEKAGEAIQKRSDK
jgi:predicted small secreted protein